MTMKGREIALLFWFYSTFWRLTISAFNCSVVSGSSSEYIKRLSSGASSRREMSEFD